MPCKTNIHAASFAYLAASLLATLGVNDIMTRFGRLHPELSLEALDERGGRRPARKHRADDASIGERGEHFVAGEFKAVGCVHLFE